MLKTLKILGEWFGNVMITVGLLLEICWKTVRMFVVNTCERCMISVGIFTLHLDTAV